MRILTITQAWPERDAPVHGGFIRSLCLHLAAQGHDITVLAPRIHRASPPQEADPPLTVHRFRYPADEKPLGALPGVPVLTMVCFLASGLFKALCLIRRTRPDIIHGHWIVPTGLIAVICGRLTGIPVMLTARGMDVRMSRHRLVRPLFDWSVRHASRVTVVSEAMREHPLLRDATVIPSGVDNAFFAREDLPRTSDIISTRHLEPLYDVATLIRALPLILERAPESRVAIVGGGTEEMSLQTLARSLGMSSSVTFHGRVDHEDLPARLASSKVYVSTSPVDGTSVSLLEALASGLIPVLTDIPANRPWAEHGRTGWLFPPGDEAALARGILSALSGCLTPPGLELRYAWSHIAREISDSYFQIQAAEGHRGRP